MKLQLIGMFLLMVVLALLPACETQQASAPVSAKWQTLPQVQAMPVSHKSGYVTSQGANIYYAIYGKGEPLILLHGGLGNTESWANQIPQFAKHYKVIAVASRGHGRSTRDNKPYTNALMTRDVLNVMDTLGIRKARVVGWSDGANIGLNLAINHPNRVSKVLAFGANYNVAGSRDDFEDNPTFHAFLSKAKSDYERLSPTPDKFDDFVKALTGMWDREPKFTPNELGSIHIPVAIAYGAHDEFIKQAHFKEMVRFIPNSTEIIFPDASHFALWQVPEKFNRLTLNFLQTSQYP